MLVEAIRLVKAYSGHTIVNGISFSIERGEVIAVIGPNGAGKTTLLEMLIGLKSPDSGSIKYWDQNFKKKMGVQLQSIPFFPGLRSIENIQLFASFYSIGLSKREATECLRLCNLESVAMTEAAKLSGGQQKRLAIAAALIHNPELIFLDEPTAALDPRSRAEIHQLIQQLSSAGKTIVFSSHDMDEVNKLATRAVMINGGKLIAAGIPSELCAQHGVDTLNQLYLMLSEEERSHV